MKKRTKAIIALIIAVSVIITGVVIFLCRSWIIYAIREAVASLGVGICMIGLFFVLMYKDVTTPLPPEPEIACAEFPYEIVCQYNGEVYAVNGDYVCEYDGIYSEWANRKLTWNSYVKGTTDDEIVLFENDKIIVYCYIGEPAYYLGSPEHTEVPEPELYCKILPEGYVVSEKEHPESFEKVCGAEIISYNLSDPIENTFVSKKWYEFWK